MTTEQTQQIERAVIDAIQDSKDYVAAYSDLNRSDEITAEEVDKIAELCFTAGATHVIESPELYGLVCKKKIRNIIEQEGYLLPLERYSIKQIRSRMAKLTAFIQFLDESILNDTK